MANSVDNLKFSIQNLDQNYIKLGLTEREIAARKQVNLNPVTIKQVYNWIDSMGLSPQIAADFKKAAGRYPQNALSKFVERHGVILGSILKKHKESDSDNSIKEEDHAKEEGVSEGGSLPKAGGA